MRSIVVAIALAGFAAPASAQEKIIGLLSLSNVFGTRQCARFEPEDVPLHDSPNDGHPFAFIHVDQEWSFSPHGGCDGLKVSVHHGDERRELPTREFDYEMPGAIVIDQRDGWLKIKLSDRSAWLKASLGDQFLPLAQLYDEFTGLTAISPSFNGRLSSSPSAIRGPIMPAVAPKTPVRVIEIKNEWVHVEVLSNSACTAGDDGPPEVVATGWLPLYDRSGEPTVWFSSRGC